MLGSRKWALTGRVGRKNEHAHEFNVFATTTGDREGGALDPKSFNLRHLDSRIVPCTRSVEPEHLQGLGAGR